VTERSTENAEHENDGSLQGATKTVKFVEVPKTEGSDTFCAQQNAIKPTDSKRITKTKLKRKTVEQSRVRKGSPMGGAGPLECHVCSVT